MNFPLKSMLALLGAGLVGCAGSPAPLSVPAPEEIPSLEARMDQEPGDVEVGLYLAAGYRESGRAEDARRLVDRLLGEAPDETGLIVMDGLLHEDAGEFAAAAEAYQRFLDTGARGPLREEVARRAEVARREALRADVRRALAQEEILAQTTPDPGTIGIFPFVFEGDAPEYEPLALVLPDLLTTDLAITGRLSVVERTKIQALIQELELGESGRVEPETAARSGRLLGSGHIVQGRFRIGPEALVDVDAALVQVGEPGQELADPLVAQDVIARFFEMEKQLAFDIYEELGLQLTAAERELVNQRQTESIEALLAYGRGLAAVDAGNFGEAQQHFSEAESLDPSFSMAANRRVEATRLSIPPAAVEAARTLASQVQQVQTKQQAVQLLTTAPAAVRERVLANLGAQQRSVLAEVLGQDRVGQVILLELVFRVPGGEE